jgi:hypothetical protein
LFGVAGMTPRLAQLFLSQRVQQDGGDFLGNQIAVTNETCRAGAYGSASSVINVTRS